MGRVDRITLAVAVALVASTSAASAHGGAALERTFRTSPDAGVTRRYTFTDFRPFTKDSPQMESGLFGPVRLDVVKTGP